MRKNLIHLAVVLTTVTYLSSTINFSSSSANSVPAKSQLPPCRIEIAAPHLSHYFIKAKMSYVVKVNAETVCDEPMTNLMLVVTLYKRGHPFDHIVRVPVVKYFASIPANKRIRVEETLAACVNFKTSTYIGVAYGQTVINGKNKELGLVKSTISAPLDCGT